MQMVACGGKAAYACSNVSSCTDRAQLKTAVDDCVGAQSCADAGIADWDVSAVTDMTQVFLSATNFNANISRWDVSAVVSMYQMFRSATNFNANISRWDVSAVTDMTQTFQSTTNFNANISR